MIVGCYIDTNILTAYYCTDPNSSIAEKLVTSIANPVVSRLTEIELLSVVFKKARKKELKAKDATRIVELFSKHLSEGYYKIVPADAESYSLAKEFLISHAKSSLHSMDALHLGIAKSRRIRFATLDKDLIKIAKKIGVDLLQ